MEGVVESYGLPVKGEIDPTTIMSFFYVFFFGMMLSDAAYGVIVAVVCGILVWKFPRMSAGMRKSLKLFFWCGLSTILCGACCSEDISEISLILFRRNSRGRRSPRSGPLVCAAERADETSAVLAALRCDPPFSQDWRSKDTCIKDRKYMDFFCDVVLWFMLLIGLILMLLPSEFLLRSRRWRSYSPGGSIHWRKGWRSSVRWASS